MKTTGFRNTFLLQHPEKIEPPKRVMIQVKDEPGPAGYRTHPDKSHYWFYPAAMKGEYLITEDIAQQLRRDEFNLAALIVASEWNNRIFLWKLSLPWSVIYDGPDAAKTYVERRASPAITSWMKIHSHHIGGLPCVELNGEPDWKSVPSFELLVASAFRGRTIANIDDPRLWNHP